MIDIKKAPTSGIIIAMFPKEIIFDYYKTKENRIYLNKRKKYLDLKDASELHLFNKDYEYRFFFRFKRPHEIIVRKEDEKKYDEHTMFHENVIIRDAFFNRAKLHIISYFEYTENDTLSLVNYRLVELIDE